jgi:hypothetical protein
MNLMILDRLNITIDLSEIAMAKAVQIDNPRYIPAMPEKGVKASGGLPYFDFTEVTLKSGKEVMLEMQYVQFIAVVKQWMIDTGGVDFNKEESTTDGNKSGKVDNSEK